MRCVLLALMLLPIPALAADIVPHVATYDVRMVASRSAGGLVHIAGSLDYRLDRTCEGDWAGAHRFRLRYDYAQEPSVEVATDTATLETADGRALDFTSRRVAGGELVEGVRGRAEGGRAVYVRPPGLAFALPEGTLLPVAHMRAVLAAASAGQKTFSAQVFEGDDARGPRLASAVITPLADPPAVEGLPPGPAWRVRMAFFPLGAQDSAPEYEVAATLHPGGVVSAAQVDYPDFSVAQSLTHFDRLPDVPGECYE
ncbi:MAG TPA: hypothetical protein DDX54_06775 [Rhodospirillaceae bacterium]|nr:hypothetical protein [Rhodospirillaceae bacterium]